MKKKKILFLLREYDFRNKRRRTDWTIDCSKIYDIDFWGYKITKTTLKSLQKKIDIFKPDFIYLTRRKRYRIYDEKLGKKIYWLPDISSIKVPKIFVEVDTWAYNSNDDWYKQFDKVYRRQYNWGSWDSVPVFRWSAPNIAFPKGKKSNREGLYFIGIYKHINNIMGQDINTYQVRTDIKKRFNQIKYITAFYENYWKKLHMASALVCPTESMYGDFIPEKLFEYLASGAAVITNCDLISYGVPDLEKNVIRYTDLDDLETKLSLDFKSYHNQAKNVMKNHTHCVRYREIFG